jgi:two-component system cell cycle response regulator
VQEENRTRSGASRRILVVDDVATNRRLLEGHLERDGYTVVQAASGEEAVDWAEFQTPDLVLLDVMMPGMDGFETCRRLRDNDATRHVPVILVTSLNDLDHKVRGQQVGADDFVTKPFDRMELLLRVRSMLRIKALHDRLSQKIAELESAKIRLRRLADTDPLTSLFNKRYFVENLRIEVDRANRYENPLSLLMIDVDHFKAINDKFGHLTGDAVLQQMATVLLSKLRTIDFVARFGGEEFAVVLPETVECGAEHVAERLRKVVGRHRFLDAEGEPLCPITISVGVAAHRRELSEADQLISLTDERLYEAKRQGRNKIVGGSQRQTAKLEL